MDLHKGGLSVWSEGEGHGCTFTLDIPLWTQPLSAVADALSASEHLKAVATTATPGAARHTSWIKARAGSGSSVRAFSYRVHPSDSQRVSVAEDKLATSDKALLRVLVVDDATTNRKMLCRLLQHKYVTLEAEDGQDAVDMVLASLDTNHSIQVVLMDNHMPRMDGPTASKLLRERGYTGVIIGVTGNTLPEDIEHFMSHGADKVLPKPVDTDVLDQTIAGTY